MNTDRDSVRAGDVRAHEQAQYATLPTPPPLPTPPALPTDKEHGWSSNDRLAGSADAQAKPASQPIPDDNGPWLVGYRVNRVNRTVLLHGFNPALKELFKGRPWATLIRDEGWIIPTQYLAHIERVLAGGNVQLFDIEGDPTPGQGNAQRDLELAHTNLVLAEIRAAEAEHDHATAHRAYLDASAALRERLAELHPEPSDVAAPVVSLGGTP